ncbi:hypothetical protein [Acidovorax sp. K2F]|uniref:hypothetical protein n=1 Tax=Acidovorax sp. K2F TaxID=2978125 RepID=UPI0021B0EE78|nr:hypothetical protein [Acidovorax sp. K2F]MCT6721674.1 hypothetical protein [Acidovorax sp. K2F]
MIRNFEIVEAVGLSFEAGYFDLHNDYKIADLWNNGGNFHIRFQRLPDSVGGQDVEIVFFGVCFLESDVLPANGRNLFISEIGYKNPDDVDYDWLLSEFLSTTEDHLFFRFDADHFLRIFAKIAEAKIV